MHSVYRCSLPVWGHLKKGTPLIYLAPPSILPDLAQNNNTCMGPKVLHPYQVSSKIHQAVLEKNLKLWKIYRQMGGWTKNGHCDMTIADLSLRLRLAKRRQIKLMEDCKGFYSKRKCELHPFNTLFYQYLMIIYYILVFFLLRNECFIPTKFH